MFIIWLPADPPKHVTDMIYDSYDLFQEFKYFPQSFFTVHLFHLIC